MIKVGVSVRDPQKGNKIEPFFTQQHVFYILYPFSVLFKEPHMSCQRTLNLSLILLHKLAY